MTNNTKDEQDQKELSTEIAPKINQADLIKHIVKQTNFNTGVVINTVKLLIEEKCTIPFISRYRKELTGGMNEVDIGNVFELHESYIEREKRRAFILETIKGMDKLTPELEKEIIKAETINQLEDIYAPYKSKKKTKGMLARDAGLAPLAELLLTTLLSLDALKKENGLETKFINSEHKINSFEDALDGACNIIIEDLAHNVEIKEKLRTRYWEDALIVSSPRKDAEKEESYLNFKDYFEYTQKVKDLKNPKASHRFLALKRGMTEKVLKVEIEFSQEESESTIFSFLPKTTKERDKTILAIINKCVKKALDLHIHSSLDLEIKSDLKKIADSHAINIFGTNLKNLLLAPYLGPKRVMGIDPGVRTGCKIAIIDNTGRYIEDFVIYPHPPQSNTRESKLVVEALLQKHNIEHIAIGNGTFGRETLQFLEENVPVIKEGKIKATIVSEAGASVYSASEIARKEFPDLDTTVRGAISIARRFQDPLAELVKIDPKSIGVGQYQHDVNAIQLKKSLESVVENCVNYVGVDINTASAPLLSFVSGIGTTLSQNIVKHREKNGKFKTRGELLEISRFANKNFEQAAGFLRIYEGENPLDATFIHPERYEIIKFWAQEKRIELNDLVKDKNIANEFKNDKSLKEKLGEFTHEDIYKALIAPSQDPRSAFKSTEFRKDVTSINDLKINEWYPGIISNIAQFGLFVDIGIKETGLVHISNISNKFLENPLDHFKVGEEIRVRVIEIDKERKRIALSAKDGSNTPQGFTGSTNGHRPKPNFNQDKHQEKPVANSAFAALKNFKVK